ncbi:Uncharacterized protein HZ326_21638, partial [Fusarium oxysporum f. sp. albedinis]
TLALQMPRLHTAVRLPCTLRTNLHTSSWNGVTTSSGSVRRREWYGRSQPQEEVIDDNDVALDPLQQARKRRQRLAATAASGSRGNKRIKLTSELDEFMARANRADVEVEDPLEWWVCHASDYPILSKMAFDLFSCPAMSAECERVFSQTKKVITDERNRLKSDTVAALECQKHLLRTGMVIIAITLAIYIRSGSTIYRKRQQLLKAQGSGSGGLSYANQSTVNNMKTTEVTITSEAATQPDAIQLQNMGHQVTVHAIGEHAEPQPPQPIARVTSTMPQPVQRPAVRPSNDVYRAAWAYTKVAMLFFAVILITWIPSSANRMYSHIHPSEVSKPLQFMSATVLPLQGFWNAVIYAVTSWAACKAVLEERGLWGSRTRINEPAWEADEERGRRRSKLKTMLNSRTEDSESLRELAHQNKSDDGRSV